MPLDVLMAKVATEYPQSDSEVPKLIAKMLPRLMTVCENQCHSLEIIKIVHRWCRDPSLFIKTTRVDGKTLKKHSENNVWS